MKVQDFFLSTGQYNMNFIAYESKMYYNSIKGRKKERN